MNLETRVYKMLLQAYPKEFRLEFGEEMLQVFRLQMKSAKLEKRTLMFWVSTVLDCLQSATREWFLRKDFGMNDKNWFLKLCAFSAFLLACSSFASVIYDFLEFPSLDKPNFNFWFSLPSCITVPLTGIGIFLSLPKQKTFLEKLAIKIIFISILASLGFSLISFNFFSENISILISYFLLFTFSIGFLLLNFSKVEFNLFLQSVRKIPFVIKILDFMIFSVFISYKITDFLSNIQFNTIENNKYNWLRYDNYWIYNLNFPMISMTISLLILAYGIWHSKPSQLNTPNLASSL